jgi:galactosamine-6-phosphate isomerase
LLAKPDLLLCAASGNTPTRTYELLAEKYRAEPNNFRSLRVLKLDEWGGIEMDDPASCESYLQNDLVRPLGVSEDRYFAFNSNPVEPDIECERIGVWLAASGPVDICVLGLGVNGHIALNEPGPFLRATSHVAQLTTSSLQHPMLANARKVPHYGLTLGMAEILASRQILLLVSGAAKREPLKRLLRREITTDFPASFLWLHSAWTLFCEAEAGGEGS